NLFIVGGADEERKDVAHSDIAHGQIGLKVLIGVFKIIVHFAISAKEFYLVFFLYIRLPIYSKLLSKLFRQIYQHFISRVHEKMNCKRIFSCRNEAKCGVSQMPDSLLLVDCTSRLACW